MKPKSRVQERDCLFQSLGCRGYFLRDRDHTRTLFHLGISHLVRSWSAFVRCISQRISKSSKIVALVDFQVKHIGHILSTPVVMSV